MWLSGVERHPGTGVFPGRGLGKGHRPALAEAVARRGFREVLGEAAQSLSHKAEHVSVCANTGKGRPSSAHSRGALLSEPIFIGPGGLRRARR